MDDCAILELFRARDERAADECRKKYGGLCFTVAMNVLGDGRDAEECVNDALLSAWESIPPESPRSLSAYLCRISRNLALNRRREASAEKRGGGEADAALSELEEVIPSPETVEDAFETGMITEAIERFLSGESRRNRAIFVRRYWYMYPVKRIARNAGLSESAASSVLHRMRKKLRVMLTKEGLI